MYARSSRPPHRYPHASPKRHRVQDSQEDALASVRHKFTKTSSVEQSPSKRIMNEMLSYGDDEDLTSDRGSHEQDRFQSFQFPRKSPTPPAQPAMHHQHHQQQPSTSASTSASKSRKASKSSQLLQAACDMGPSTSTARVSKIPLVPVELCFCGQPVEEDSIYCGTPCARQDALRALNGDSQVSSRTKEAERRAKEEKFRQAEEAIKARQVAAQKMKEREHERAERLAKWRNVISKSRPNEGEHARNESSSTVATHSTRPSLSASSVASYQTAESSQPSTPDSPSFPASTSYTSQIPLYPATPRLNESVESNKFEKTPTFLTASPSYAHNDDILNAYLLRTPTHGYDASPASGGSSGSAKTTTMMLTPATRTADALRTVSLVSPLPRSDSLKHFQRNVQQRDSLSVYGDVEEGEVYEFNGDDDEEGHDSFSHEGLERVHASLSRSTSRASSAGPGNGNGTRGHVRGKLSFDDVVGILSS